MKGKGPYTIGRNDITHAVPEVLKHISEDMSSMYYVLSHFQQHL